MMQSLSERERHGVSSDNLYCKSLNKMRRIVQTEGYVPMNKRIMEILNAGLRLASARAEQYDADMKTPAAEVIGDNIRRLELLEGLYQTTCTKNYLEGKKNEQLRKLHTLKERQKAETPRVENVKKSSFPDTTNGVGHKVDEPITTRGA